ncbi:serine protease [Vibrio splendidus]
MSETKTINPLSISSVFIEMKYNDEVLGVGTAFYYKKDDKLYLLSNWHNYSGRNPETKRPIHSQAALPNQIKVYSYKVLGESIELNEQTYPLQDENGDSLWYEHGELGSKVDVAALPINIDFEVLDINEAINEIDPYDNRALEIGENLFVLGYPFGISGGSYFPIWKSASIASEPEIDCDSLPLFYIDTATREGMSGSPVVKYKDRPVSLISNDRKVSSFAEFVGVYSGRIIPKDLIEVQLGKVWKASCIDKVLSGSLYVDA